MRLRVIAADARGTPMTGRRRLVAGLWRKEGSGTDPFRRRFCDRFAAMVAAPSVVAVVEDEDGIRESVVFALEREGYRAASYADGRTAWTAFDRELPSLAILDIGLPGLDGREDLCGQRFERRSGQ